MSTSTVLFAGTLLVSVVLALGSYLGLLIRELAADRRASGTSEDIED
jgi:hypothetical protein